MHPHALTFQQHKPSHYKGWYCDICNSAISSNAYHCRQCEYDECSHCHKGTHPHGLDLEMGFPDGLSRVCDICNRSIGKADRHYHCPICPAGGYDECSDCYYRRRPNICPPKKRDRMHEDAFREKVAAALKAVARILHTERQPAHAADVPHTYADKYALVEGVARTATKALALALARLGLDPGALESMHAWHSQGQAVTLRLDTAQQCEFVREVVREVPSAEQVVETTGPLGLLRKKTKVITKVTEYEWKVTCQWEFRVYAGVDAAARTTLTSRQGHCIVKTLAKSAPYPESQVRQPIQVEIGWLLYRTLPGASPFTIDRERKSCRTPSRNEEVSEAMRAVKQIYRFADAVTEYFESVQFPIQHNQTLHLSSVHADGVFVPVLPLLEKDKAGGAHTLSDDWEAFLNEQVRSLDERLQELRTAFPADEGVVCQADVCFVATTKHLQDVCDHFRSAVSSVEAMLHAQVVAAIGKEVGPEDFAEYMCVHARRLFRPEFRPQQFCHAIRWDGHSPEGTISIEANRGKPGFKPIHTVVMERTGAMSFPLNSATTLRITGTQSLHALVAHSFDQSTLQLQLCARARQFSSFVVVLGRMCGAGEMQAVHAIVLSNKDALNIPIDMEVIPSAKAFKAAIQSLSPEQLRFAKAFRAMQLQSTLFAVCVIQIKPALERLLCLPPDSLTKELKLTQDLLALFLDYQVPSDIVSFNGDADTPPHEKVAQVKKCVDGMHSMIANIKTEELKRKKEEDKMRKLEAQRRDEEEVMRQELEGGYLRSAGMLDYECDDFAEAAEMCCDEMGMDLDVKACGLEDVMMRKGDVINESDPADPEPQVEKPAEEKPADDNRTNEKPEIVPGSSGADVDFTKYPASLDARLEEVDKEGSVRPTILRPAPFWERKHFKSLLAPQETESMFDAEQHREKARAFDLLDALSKSGALCLHDSSLHVVMAATHCFTNSCMRTLVRDNINPIERFESSLLHVASVVHNQPPRELVPEDQLPRLAALHPDMGF